ncbi:MAG: hypothetical protein CL947_04470 [Epsilonproteobacteria bacterium]|nr:hypothetical protein [Campylobacterota bacterium]
MALYFYRALSKTGKKTSGYIDAASEELVRSDLANKNLYSIEIKIHKESNENFFQTLLARPVAFKDLIFFTKQLAVLLKSGVPLAQSLELLSEQFNGKLRSIIIGLKDNLKEGKSLAEGLQVYPKTFSNIYIQLVKAGEATGKLDTILERLTTYLERQEEIKKRVSGALSYPLFQLGIIGLIVIGIMTFVIPNMQGMLTKKGLVLPDSTKFLLAVSNLLVNHYTAVLFILLAIAALFEYWRSQPQGKRTLDQIKLKLPMIKYFARTSAIIQFCQTLGMLIESGVTLSHALDIVCNIIDNSILVETLEQAKEKIVKQGKITPFLKETGIFPPMALYLINTGEQSGNLGYMLLTVAQNYESELTELTDSLTSKITPIMTLIMGAVVGFIMYSIMGPILSMQEITGI